MKKTISSVMIICAASLWGIIALFYNRLAILGFSELQIVWLRVVSATVMMLCYLGIYNKQLFRIHLKDCWMFLGTGIVSLAFFNYCYFSAIAESSASTAAVLLYTAPVFVMILSVILFKEKMTFVKIGALACTLVGCFLVTEIANAHRITMKGLLFGLGSGFGYAMYTIFGKIALRNYRTETITAYTFIFALLGVTALCQPWNMIPIIYSAPAKTIGYSLGIGFASTLLPYLLYTKGLQHTTAGRASVIATLEPVVATIVSVLVLHDTLSVSKVIGITLVIGAIVIMSIFDRSTKKTGND